MPKFVLTNDEQGLPLALEKCEHGGIMTFPRLTDEQRAEYQRQIDRLPQGSSTRATMQTMLNHMVAMQTEHDYHIQEIRDAYDRVTQGKSMPENLLHAITQSYPAMINVWFLPPDERGATP